MNCFAAIVPLFAQALRPLLHTDVPPVTGLTDWSRRSAVPKILLKKVRRPQGVRAALFEGLLGVDPA